ncbi:MAG: FAD-dependent oxidoreductase [Proteobacteria bacterium]|nr:FAD-dependent oxidoreductase [Pseudomonadota bacterium]
MRLAVVGAGWAGLACAVHAVRAGHEVAVFEAARIAGGRARRVETDGGGLALDNGQHILIGAYSATLSLMRELGVQPESALLRTPLQLRFADGGGIALPRLPAPLDLAAGILSARGWTWRDKLGLLRTALAWRAAGFRCDAKRTVADLCAALTPRVTRELIEPLCVSALNTPLDQSSGQVFLRVLHDALFAERGGADLMLPRVDLGRLLPDAAGDWLLRHGAQLRLGRRVQALRPDAARWQVDGEPFDRVVLAGPPWEAARLVAGSSIGASDWVAAAEGLRYEAIATVYVQGAKRVLNAPMVALRNGPLAPAQFVFDRSLLGGPKGLLAFVVSASTASREQLQAQVLAQAAAQLNESNLQIVQTVVEKRATFACTPGLVRPPMQIAAGLLACGDYVEGPYPATLEGAIRSGCAAASQLGPAS